MRTPSEPDLLEYLDSPLLLGAPGKRTPGLAAREEFEREENYSRYSRPLLNIRSTSLPYVQDRRLPVRDLTSRLWRKIPKALRKLALPSTQRTVEVQHHAKIYLLFVRACIAIRCSDLL